jgi:predicted transport protein
MSDIKLFRIGANKVAEEQSRSVTVEKSLQTLIERHLDAFLSVRFLDSEYSTGKTHGGRIDTLGIDEDNSPVIIEYKRATNENVINQGLYYLDWLMDHKAEFQLLVQKRLGVQIAEDIDWSTPRLICIAGDFTKYDEYAVQQINRNIELLRYRRFADDLLVLELINRRSTSTSESASGTTGQKPSTGSGRIADSLAGIDPELNDRFEALKAFLSALGDDVQMKTLKHYIVFKRLRNFASVEVHPTARKITAFVKVDPKSVVLTPGFTRDVTDIGHYGTGDLEIVIDSDQDLEDAKPLFVKSYEAS